MKPTTIHQPILARKAALGACLARVSDGFVMDRDVSGRTMG